MADDLESCAVELPASSITSDEKDSLKPKTSELRGVLNLVSGTISVPTSLSEEGDSTHYSMPSREYIATKEFICLYFSAGEDLNASYPLREVFTINFNVSLF